MSIGQRMLISAILSFLTIVSGIWVGSSGRPYNTVIFTIHKLTALAAVVFTVVFVIQLFKNIDIKNAPIILIIISIVSVIVLFASGVLLSIGKSNYILLRMIHMIFPILTVGTAATAIYLLISKK